MAKSDDGTLDVHLRLPVELGGPGGGTNPEQLLAASYAACEVNAAALAPPTAPDPHALACAIHRELAAEHGMDSTCAPGRPASSDSDGLENWLQLHAARLRSGCLVLCSPTATKIGLQSAGYAIGTYTDIYGNLLDLETRRYRALVLAVGAVDAQGNALAAEALSPPSQIFPPFAAG